MAPKPTQLPAHLSFALWATASLAFGQDDAPITLQPMASMAADPDAAPVLLTAMVSTTALTTNALISMVSQTRPITVSLTAMAIQPNTPAPTLTAMVTQPSATSGLLSPMLVAASGKDLSFYSLAHPTRHTVIANTGPGNVSGPVTALMPLPPLLQITPTTAKALVLKRTGPNRQVVAASSGPFSAITSAFTGSSVVNTPVPNGPPQLTDSELSPNPNIPTVTRPDEEVLSVDVLVNGIQRRGLMDVYQDSAQNLWLPLTQLAQMLEIPISINPGAGVAQGWYQSPANTLVLNLATGKMGIGQQSYAVNGQAEKHTTDLFITATALKQWFGVDSHLDYNLLQLTLTTPAPLPGDLHNKRQENWASAQKNLRNPAMPSDTIIPGTSNFSIPVVRIGTNTNFNYSPESSAALSSGLTLQAENDIMGADSNIALSFSQQPDGKSGLTGGSLLLQKQSEKTDLLGPLHARYFGVGDITANPLPLSGAPATGRGLHITNTPLGSVTNPDQYILTGPAPINWDAEVYQDQALVAFQHIDATGMYRFTALPLKSGRNNFRIVLYGPNGEREERRETTYLGNNIPAMGEWQYDTAVFQPNQSIIPGLPSTISTTSTVAQAQLITGLSKNWALTTSAYQMAGSPETLTTTGVRQPEQGVGAGLRGTMGSTYLTSDVFRSNNGTALQATFRAPITQTVDVNIGQSRNIGFNPDDRDELTTTNAQLSMPFTIGKTGIGTTYGYAHTTYQTQPPRDTYSQRTSLGVGPINATNQLNYVTQNNATEITGDVETAVHAFGRSVNAGLTYAPNSPEMLRQFNLSTQIPTGPNQTLNLNYTQQLTAAETSTLGSSFYWRTGPWAVGVLSSANSAGNVNVGVNLATALVPQGYRQASWKLAPPDATLGQGQAAVRVFVDENANNRYDIGEPLLQGVTVDNNLRGTHKVTNAKGIASFSDLTPRALARLSIDTTSLPDIYLKPVSDTLNVLPHTGDNGILNYALAVYGEISGQAKTPAGQPVENLSIAIFDTDGKQLDTTTSEYDGYFTFGALPMGTYTISTASTSPTTITLTSKTRIQAHNLTVRTPY